VDAKVVYYTMVLDNLWDRHLDFIVLFHLFEARFKILPIFFLLRGPGLLAHDLHRHAYDPRIFLVSSSSIRGAESVLRRPILPCAAAQIPDGEQRENSVGFGKGDMEMRLLSLLSPRVPAPGFILGLKTHVWAPLQGPRLDTKHHDAAPPPPCGCEEPVWYSCMSGFTSSFTTSIAK
jgi:hypothetical protein